VSRLVGVGEIIDRDQSSLILALLACLVFDAVRVRVRRSDASGGSGLAIDDERVSKLWMIVD